MLRKLSIFVFDVNYSSKDIVHCKKAFFHLLDEFILGCKMLVPKYVVGDVDAEFEPVMGLFIWYVQVKEKPKNLMIALL